MFPYQFILLNLLNRLCVFSSPYFYPFSKLYLTLSPSTFLLSAFFFFSNSHSFLSCLTFLPLSLLIRSCIVLTLPFTLSSSCFVIVPHHLTTTTITFIIIHLFLLLCTYIIRLHHSPSHHLTTILAIPHHHYHHHQYHPPPFSPSASPTSPPSSPTAGGECRVLPQQTPSPGQVIPSKSVLLRISRGGINTE